LVALQLAEIEREGELLLVGEVLAVEHEHGASVHPRLDRRRLSAADRPGDVDARHLSGELGSQRADRYDHTELPLAADLTDVGGMRDGAADGIDRGVADDEIVVGAVGAEGIVAGRADLGTRLPPAVLTADHARLQAVVEPGTGPHAPLRR